jgi:hypothetical protein
MIIFFWQATNTLPYKLLYDYACLDNMKQSLLENSYHRTCINYAQLARNIYKSSSDTLSSTSHIRDVLRRNPDEGSHVKITSFRNLLKFKEAVPPLLELLSAGGIWSLDCERAFKSLGKCRIEEVCKI